MDNIGHYRVLFFKNDVDMTVKISTKRKEFQLDVKALVANMSEDGRYTNLDIRLHNETEAQNAYESFIAIGIKCCWAGKNAPTGPAVFIYNNDKNCFKLKTM